jgi:hypothetical protein
MGAACSPFPAVPHPFQGHRFVMENVFLALLRGHLCSLPLFSKWMIPALTRWSIGIHQAQTCGVRCSEIAASCHPHHVRTAKNAPFFYLHPNWPSPLLPILHQMASDLDHAFEWPECLPPAIAMLFMWMSVRDCVPHNALRHGKGACRTWREEGSKRERQAGRKRESDGSNRLLGLSAWSRPLHYNA